MYRYGGEELAVLFNRTNAEPAANAAERVMAAVRDLAVAFPESEHGIVTVSAGLVHCDAQFNSVDDVVAKADSRLYESKHNGRNRMTTA